MRPSRTAILTTLALACAVAAGCSVNPATGKRHLNLTSEAQEIEMGRQSDREVAASIGVYPDSSLNRYVQALGSSLAAASERPDLPWTFRVVDDPVVNAFAIPGGFIYVTRGILAHLDNEAELAGVLGHEIGHVTAQHSVHRMATQQLTQLGLGIGTAIKPELEPYAQLASAGLGLLFLKFSREDESEADALGVRYMTRKNYSPDELAAVMAMLKKVSEAGGGGRVPEWMATHPDPANRAQDIAELVKANPTTPDAQVNRDAYLRRLDGLMYGNNPREGFFRGSTFHHPDLAFRFDFPPGWSTSNQKQGVAAVSKEQDALLQVTMSRAASADQAAREFFAQAGLTTTSAPAAATVNGLGTVSGGFSAQTGQGVLRGLATFVSHGGNVYQVLGYTSQESWSVHEAAISKASRSFGRLTDTAMLSVKPQRLEIVTLKKAMSLAEFNRTYPSGIPIEELALLNQVEPGATLRSGMLVKRVVGDAVP